MKVLLVTDIHSDYDAARAAYNIEKPDFALDCGDHKEIVNLFELTPHFYIFGNHEPSSVHSDFNTMPLPVRINPGMIFELAKEKEIIRVAGLDGNYTTKDMLYNVDGQSISFLRLLKPKSVDVLLLHESPLDLDTGDCVSDVASDVVGEIERINPKMVFSGHFGKYQEQYTPNKVPIFCLDDMHKGYGILSSIDGNLLFERKRAFFAQK